MLPLVAPILAVTGLLAFIGTINEFLIANVFLTDTESKTLAVGMFGLVAGEREQQLRHLRGGHPAHRDPDGAGLPAGPALHRLRPHRRGGQGMNVGRSSRRSPLRLKGVGVRRTPEQCTDRPPRPGTGRGGRPISLPVRPTRKAPPCPCAAPRRLRPVRPRAGARARRPVDVFVRVPAGADVRQVHVRTTGDGEPRSPRRRRPHATAATSGGGPTSRPATRSATTGSCSPAAAATAG